MGSTVGRSVGGFVGDFVGRSVGRSVAGFVVCSVDGIVVLFQRCRGDCRRSRLNRRRS